MPHHPWYRCILLTPFFFLSWEWLGACWNNRSATFRAVLSLSLGFALLVAFTLFTASWTQDLSLSLAIGSAFSMLGGGWLHFYYREKPRVDWKIPWSWELVPLALWFFATTTLVALIAIRFDFHDQLRSQGHPAVIESMMRGNFPPHLQVFPDIPLKYHFGGDLLAAIFGYVTDSSGIQAINLLQVSGWIAAVLTLYVLARELGMSRLLSLLALQWLLLGSGWLYLLKPWLNLSRGGEPYLWPDSYPVFNRYLNPSLASYFFQTPYALGLPLFFLYLTLFLGWLKARSDSLLASAALVLGTLSIVHAPLFLSCLASTGLCLGLSLLRERGQRKSLGLSLALLSVVALLLAKKFGGFFVASSAYSKGLTVWDWPPGFLNHARPGGGDLGIVQTLLWYLCTFGSVILIAPVSLGFGLLRVHKSKDAKALFFILFALICFSIPQSFHYALSWDIIKWFTGFHMAIVLLTLYLLGQRTGKISWLLLLLSCLVLLDSVPGMRFFRGLGLKRPEELQGSEKNWLIAKIPPITPDLQFIVGHLRNSPWNETLLAPHLLSESLERYSGQSTATLDYNTIAFGVLRGILDQRNQTILAIEKNFSTPLLDQSPIHWMLYSCKDFDKTFSPKSQLAIQEAVERKDLEAIDVPQDLGCWKFYHRVPSTSRGQ